MLNEEYHKHDETNRLIAEFMGLTVEYNEWVVINEGQGVHREYRTQARYHQSWDWLMPVIERIQREGFKTSIENNWTSIDGCTDETDGIWFETTGANLNMLQATYEAVVKFIKWYNDNK